MQEHITAETTQEYSLGKLAEARVAALEEHLLVCDACRERLEEIEAFNHVHFTQDGPVYLRATRLTTGKVMARNWGKDLSGSKVLGSVAAAERYLTESFAMMFPEHHCVAGCGPTAPSRSRITEVPARQSVMSARVEAQSDYWPQELARFSPPRKRGVRPPSGPGSQ